MTPRRPLPRRLPDEACGAAERGSSAIELAILGPSLLVLTMLVVQWVLWFEARDVALASAQAGAEIARQQQPGWPSQSVARAASFYSQVGPRLLSAVTAQVNPPGGTPSQVSVTVTGTVPTLLPSWLMAPLTVHETSGGDVECFRPSATAGRKC